MVLLRWIPLIAAVVVLTNCATLSNRQRVAATEAAIRALLKTQVADWNRGDIEAFMKGYVHSEALRFAGASGVNRGFDATLARYRKAYPGKEGMGHLRFSDLEIMPLSRTHAEVFGRYHLKRGGAYEDATGLFTLLMKRMPDGWRIVHDHSSALNP